MCIRDSIGILENIGTVVIIKAGQHDMATLHQPEPCRLIAANHPILHLAHKGPGGINQGAGEEGSGLAMWRFRRDVPKRAFAPRAGDSHAGQNAGPAFRRILRIQQHKARIFHPAIGIFKADGTPGAEWRTQRRACQVNPPCRRQRLSPTQMIIQKQPKPQ